MTPDGFGPLHFDPDTFLVDDLWVLVPPGPPAPDRQSFLAVDLGYADGRSVRVVPAFTGPGRAADYLAGSGLGARGYTAVSPASRLGLATALAHMQAAGESFVGIDPTARPDPTRPMPLLPIDAMVSALADAEAGIGERAGPTPSHPAATL
jgi:hypothetical protein